MRMTSEEVLAAVSRTLFEQVLPELPAASWLASHVRACAMLLVYLQDRVATEQPMLREANAVMRRFLNATADGQAADNAMLRDVARKVCANFTADAKTDLVDMRRENESCKAALESIVDRAAILRARPGGDKDTGFRAALQECMTAVEAYEAPVSLCANQYFPL